MASFADFLAAQAHQQNEDGRELDDPRRMTDIQLQAQAMDLRGLYERYDAFLNVGCPFKPGQFVKPRVESQYHNTQAPCVVLEVRDRRDTPIWTGNDSPCGNNTEGARPDMRIGRIANGCVVAWWAESFDFELYTGPMPE
jgi:hypothetical protein